MRCLWTSMYFGGHHIKRDNQRYQYWCTIFVHRWLIFVLDLRVIGPAYLQQREECCWHRRCTTESLNGHWTRCIHLVVVTCEDTNLIVDCNRWVSWSIGWKYGLHTTYCPSIHASGKRQWKNTAFFLQEIICKTNIPQFPTYDITTYRKSSHGYGRSAVGHAHPSWSSPRPPVLACCWTAVAVRLRASTYHR